MDTVFSLIASTSAARLFRLNTVLSYSDAFTLEFCKLVISVVLLLIFSTAVFKF